MPGDLLLRGMNAVHRAGIALTRGRRGWHVARMPVLELTTTGRRTGREHRVMLTSPLQLGETYVVVASRGGDDRPPAWLLNLATRPEVRVRIQGGPERAARARVATPSEREALWPRVTSAHPRYAGYQARTTREIPLVLVD